MYQEIVNKEKKIAVIGLGYVGLPIALEFAKKVSVIGFDINATRVAMMQKNIDPSNELDADAFTNADIVFTSEIEDLKDAHFFIVAVPTPVDEHNVPDLKPVLSATETVAKVLKKGDYVVFESTVYPGCTEEDCLPILEKISGLNCNQDFKLGYSPERINPGDKVHNLQNVIKIVSGSDAASLEEIAKVYELVVQAGVHRATEIKVAEAAKIIENTQRDVNIALMNELSIIFDKIGINTYEVLEAAGTKWNFAKYYPGLVGGHCIGVDPFYLTYKAEQLGYKSKIILSGRSINDEMPSYIAKKVIKHLIDKVGDIKKSRTLVLGITFKENVSDIRNSKVAGLVSELLSFNIPLDVVDPMADKNEVKEEYGFDLSTAIADKYDALIVAVNHNEYKEFDVDYFSKMLKPNALLFDVKGIYRHLNFEGINYQSL